MIKIKLKCNSEHSFEGWFKSNFEYENQLKSDLIQCPTCNSSHISCVTDQDIPKIRIHKPSVVSHQEIKMISDQFSKDSLLNKDELLMQIENGYLESEFELNQSEIKDLNEEGLSSILTALKSIEKDKLN